MKKISEEQNRSKTPLQEDASAARTPQRPIRVIAITSGKGGVGKTNIAANLAYHLSQMKKKTLILDADMGLANIDVILGLAPKYNLSHVLSGEKALADVILEGPGGMQILPASSGIQEMAELSKGEKLALLDELGEFGGELDFLLIDTAAGIAGNVIYFNVAAREIIVVVSPEPTSITDAYALIKILYSNYGEKRFMLLANMVRNSSEARDVFLKVSNATSHFLNLSIDYLGYVLDDTRVTDAVRRQKAVAEIYPDSRASKCLQSIARKLCKLQPEFSESGSLKFFWKSIVDKGRG
ncbi:MAG TPA: MinD/ParA family protein [Syntrophales bacterium]|nr:MinD/ParA family protein [Syntrophales bacterium]